MIDKTSGLEWIRENRLESFLQSELYADYKLTKILTSAQVDIIEIYLLLNKLLIYHL